MERKRLLVLAAILGVAGIATGCKDQSVRDYLSDHGGPNAMYEWEIKVEKAICQLEVNNPNGLDPALRICPNGPTDIIPPPKYPPQ